MINLEEIFEEYNDECNKFDRIENPAHPRPDICAFLMLHSLVPGTMDMVSYAYDDEIYLDVEPDALASVATKEQVRDLIRCGVRYCSDTDSLCMFV